MRRGLDTTCLTKARDEDEPEQPLTKVINTAASSPTVVALGDGSGAMGVASSTSSVVRVSGGCAATRCGVIIDRVFVFCTVVAVAVALAVVVSVRGTTMTTTPAAPSGSAVPYPIDCVDNWSTMSSCSSSFAGGTRSLIYNISSPRQNGRWLGACNVEPCALNCQGQWSISSSCSTTCEDGTRQHTYPVALAVSNDGAISPTADADVQEQSYSDTPCSVDCQDGWRSSRGCNVKPDENATSAATIIMDTFYYAGVDIANTVTPSTTPTDKIDVQPNASYRGAIDVCVFRSYYINASPTAPPCPKDTPSAMLETGGLLVDDIYGCSTNTSYSGCHGTFHGHTNELWFLSTRVRKITVINL